MTHDLDPFDIRLLNLMQENAALTAEQLADHVPLSPSAIQRRLRRLRKDGVIVGQTVIVEPRHVGRPTFFVVGVQVERERPEHLHEFSRWLQGEPCVQQAFYVTGEADYVLVVTAPDTQSYQALMVRMMAENPNVKRFTTNVALNLVKRSLSIPIPMPERA